jgi:demethylspheroidene O-methyltransferase
MLGGAIVANPGICAMVEHHALAYVDFADPVALLEGRCRETRLGSFWSYTNNVAAASIDASRAAAYSTLMTRSQPMLVDDILDAYPFENHRSILDVGGGEGGFLLAMAQRFSRPSLHLFDLPPVAERAAARFDDAGLAGRFRATGGNFFTDPLPEGHDAVTLVRIAHDHDDDKAMVLFSRIRRALAPGGVLIIAEPMSGAPDSTRVADVYFAFYLLAMGSGRPRSARQLAHMLEASGFGEVRSIPTARPMLVSMIAARAKPMT